MQNPLVEIRSIRNPISRRWSGQKAPERTEPETGPVETPQDVPPVKSRNNCVNQRYPPMVIAAARTIGNLVYCRVNN
jgi:hypothetical protein